uniref:PepSY domain-containing protein n=1 Tax=uncultured Cytophaga sp. TaxID=160238 RepID=UPI0026255FD7
CSSLCHQTGPTIQSVRNISFHWIKNVFIIGLGGESIVLSEDNLEMKKNISKSFTVLLNQLQNDQNKINTKKTTIEYIKNLTDSILPYSGQTTFILPNELSNFYTIEKLNNNNWGGMYFPDRISFTPAGNIATIELFSKLKLYEKFKCIAKPLHTGEIVGLPGIIIYFIASMIGCSLPITGFIIWWKKKKY